MLDTDSTIQFYADLSGNPLQGGQAYFGASGQNPVTSPITVYWDAAGTQPAAQPVAVSNGRTMRNGAPARVYIPSDYSKLVRDGLGRQVSFDASIPAPIRSSLAGDGGAALVGFKQDDAAAISRTIQDELRLRVSPRQFGLYLGAAADSQAMVQAAINHAFAAGGGDVLIDAVYKFFTPIIVQPGVNLVHAIGGKLVRAFSSAVSGPAIYLKGDNVVWNVHYDGGSGSIAVADFTLYQDFTNEGATGGAVLFVGGSYASSCGSFIIARGKAKVLGVNFGEYLDHAVYAGDGGVAAANTKDVLIQGCTVEAPNATRAVFKARNGMDGYRILHNYVNAPNASSMLELSIGDAAIAARQVKNVWVDGNRATTQSFVEFNTSDPSVLFEGIRFGEGNVGTHTSYTLRIGNFPAGAAQNGIGAKDISIRGKYTTTLAGGNVILNGDLTNMIETIDLQASFEFVTNEDIYIFGNIKHLSIGGRHKCTNPAGTGKVVNQSAFFANDAFKPSILGTVTVRGAVTDGWMKNIFNEVSNGGSVTSGFRFNLVVEHCTMLGPLTKQVFNCSGPKVGDATGTAILRNNQLDGVSVPSTYKPGFLIEESNAQKVLQSPNGTKWSVTVSDAGAIAAGAI